MPISVEHETIIKKKHQEALKRNSDLTIAIEETLCITEEEASMGLSDRAVIEYLSSIGLREEAEQQREIMVFREGVSHECAAILDNLFSSMVKVFIYEEKDDEFIQNVLWGSYSRFRLEGYDATEAIEKLIAKERGKYKDGDK